MSLTAVPSLPLEETAAATLVDRDAIVAVERNPWQFAYFFIPTAIAMLSWVGGGIPFLTDLSFVCITILCFIFLFGELKSFNFRWGIGGLLAYGGPLVWFCYDYFDHWFGAYGNADDLRSFPTETLALATAHHALFIMCMSFGLRLRLGGYLDRFLARMPEPSSEKMYVALIGLLFIFGMSPYVFFTQEGLIQAFWNDLVGGRAGGAMWTAGRTGNVNYNFGAYLAQVLQVAAFASILGGFYAVNVARSWAGRIYGMAIWLPSAALGFGSGTRGAFVIQCLPLVGFLFLRFQFHAASLGKRMSFKAYGWLFAALFGMLVVVQTQIAFRGSGFRDADFSQVNVTQVEGNSMFSESLKGFYLIPRYLDPFYSKYPGQGFIMPVIDTTYWFFVSPIPRAIWTSKPIDEVWQWYNNTVAGTQGTEGTTISNGAVGHFYFRYGLWGTIEGGLIYGFLMGCCERLLRYYAAQKPIVILVALGLATFLFRAFRGFQWIEFHATMVGLSALALTIYAMRPFFGGKPGQGFAVE